MNANEKYAALLERLIGLESVLVAFSGGVDSTLVAFAAHAVLGERCLAVMAASDTYSESEAANARELAAGMGFRLLEVETCELADPLFTANGPDRCYHCKNELFGLLQRVADVEGLAHVADGANADDRLDYRPGSKAAREREIVSPLADVGFTKREIREIAKDLGLPNWNRPSMACLASRFPYYEPITDAGLARVSSAEQSLRDLGLTEFRVRSHGTVARVEVGAAELERAWQAREGISRALHEAGFTYASLDLEGYRSGSMNDVLRPEEQAPGE
ncbi:MAG: ATP-dependent sacrificial sulfur transferase LarE [Coriobacteriia bacterium]